MEKKEQEVAEEYLSSLADLNLNSKPLINMLTILAEENIEYASVIVKSVEQHIAKVSPDVKLPVLYLIDSIVKNVGREYIQLFSHCIVNIFCGVFEKVNEKIREKMYTLRQTWNDVFTPQKLYTLDVKVNCMDPNWPITAKVVPKSPAIHVNPNFLKNKSEPLNEMQAKLRDKQRQLLELEKRKLELQLAVTKQRLEEQEKQLTMQTEKVVNMPPAVIPPPIRGAFNPYKVGLQRHPNPMHLPPNMMAGNQQMIKTRVAPVNPTMLNSLRYRDPRLARQQQQQQQQAQQQQQQQQQAQQQQQQQPKQEQQQQPAVEQQKSAEEVPSTSVSSTKVESSENETAKGVDSSVEAKKSDGDSERAKALNLKSHYGNKEKIKTSASQNEKRSSSKSSYEKGSSATDKSPPTRSSSSNISRNKISRISKNSSSKPYDKDSRNRERQSSFERKKSSKTDLPAKYVDKQAVSKQTDKSPKRIESSKSLMGSPNAKFKDIKQGIKARNYMRRNREKSKSPSPPKDVDFRAMGAQTKRAKLAEKTDRQSEQEQAPSEREPSPPKISSAPNESKQPDLEQNLEPVSSKDIDLRQFQSNSAKVENSSGAVGSAKNVEGEQPPAKRPSVDNAEDQPLPKKSRQEKLDALFGTEDVDLRTLNGPVPVPQSLSSPVMPMTPPPPPIISSESESWAKVKGTKSSKIPPTPKSTLDDVRAKLAKAAKCQLAKPEKEKESRPQSRLADLNEDSQDGTDANIRTIMSQAQELLDTENMNVEQYNTLVKTVIHINETNKLKEAQRRESLLSKSTESLDVAHNGDEENKNKLPEDKDKLANAKEKVKPFIKRIPKISKEGHNEPQMEQTSILQRMSPPITNTTVSSFTDSRTNANGKPEKRSRQREPKWSSFPWEAGHSTNINQKPWLPPNNHRPNFIPKQSQQPVVSNARMPIPNPWQNPPPMIFAAPPPMQMPSIQMPPIAPVSTELPIPTSIAPVPPSQFGNSVDNPKTDVVRTINIDSMAKEIRIYDEVAVVFMDWDQPREIGFQSGQRRIIIDDKEPIVLNFNDDYKTIIIDGKPHKIRFGCPSRELYIDDNWYECCFGGPPLAIPIDGQVHVFKIEGPPPQVNIGSLRQDLVAGKINLIVDARIIIPVFLDATLQTFELDGQKHTLQFADFLQTVLINNEPIQVEYGGLPKSYYIGGIKYFARFSTLPNGIVPGEVMIKNMVKTEKFKPVEKPLVSVANETPSTMVPKTESAIPSVLPQIPLTQPAEPLKQEDEVKPQVTSALAPIAPTVPQVSSLNIDDLFQKLLASGILNQTVKNGKPEANNKVKSNDVITPVDLSKPETIKTRQAGIIQKLFSGMQCSSCGVRFPPEQTMKYSQHLDWHFRQNRRERDSSRKAHSRKWYYDVSDWIQYEEIEDLEDREKNWFEAQQTELDVDENSNPKVSSPVPSCPAGPDDVDRSCDMCHDKFEQFYSEEFEEWHLRSAIRVEDKIYHPLCYQDYKAALAAEAEAATKPTEESIEDTEESVVIVKEEKGDKEESDEIATLSEGDDDDDDVIVVPIEESVTEIPDDDDEEEIKVLQDETSQQEKTPETAEVIAEDVKADTATEVDKNESVESDVEIQEPHIPFTDLDTYEEQPPQSVSTLDESSQSSQFNNVRIKEEPKDDDDDDDAFEDVGTFVSVDDISQSLDEYVPQPINSTTTGPDTQIASIDGNVEIQDAPTTSVGVNKIKINITKSVGTSQKANVSPPEAVSNIPVICNVQETVNKIESVVTENKSASQESQDVSSIDFTFKPELRDVDLKVVPKFDSGYETSGLCSIM